MRVHSASHVERRSTMTGHLTGKVALITGAARGLGRAVAVRPTQDGADVVAVVIAAPSRRYDR
jgi:NAD(P)-dependent dehydrogenase (short-subunit alcohol dehydrogenase family)